MKVRFMNIKDKIIISKTRVCPPHCIFHKLPFTKKVINEPCHYHKKKWRTAHHTWFCKYLKCPNYKFMIKESKNERNI